MAELRAIEALISICGVMDNPCCDYYYKRRTRLIKRLIPSDCHDVFNKPFPPCKGIFAKVRS